MQVVQHVTDQNPESARCARVESCFECLKEPPDHLIVTYTALYDSLKSSISLLIVLRYLNLLDNL